MRSFRLCLLGLVTAVCTAACGSPDARDPSVTMGQGGNTNKQDARSSANPPNATDAANSTAADASSPDSVTDKPTPEPKDAATDGVIAAMPDAAKPLPPKLLDVFAQFPAQGWFGDGSLTPFFSPNSSLIKQQTSQEGPCAPNRKPAGVGGTCIKITYQPPANLSPPTGGGWVGAFWLPILLKNHPELMPPVFAGGTNWGQEPGVKVTAPPAQVTFWYVAERPLTIAFKAGIAQDTFTTEEVAHSVTTEWQRGELKLNVVTPIDNVYGAFAWVHKATTEGFTLYLADVAWR